MTTFLRYLPLALLAVAWEIGARTGIVSTLALPPLSAVIAAWIDLVKDGDDGLNAGAPGLADAVASAAVVEPAGAPR